jgi:hypothetical protein
MPKKTCCCVIPRDEESFCCEPFLFEDFLTLFGDDMAEHSIVSPKDWVALYVPRPGTTSKESIMTGDPGPGCNCCGCEENDSQDSCPPNNEGCNQPLDPTASQDDINRCRCGCCSKYRERSLVDGAAPIIFAYKYSGCHITWHPREYAFNYNPYISQCTGWLSNIPEGQGGGIRQVSCHPFYEQPIGRGASPSEFLSECVGYNPINYDSPYFPCGCVPFPHLNGGVYDSVYNRVNVSLNPEQLGYVSFMAPFHNPMLSSEKDCCWCANAGAADSYESFLKNRKEIYLNTYPYVDQSGKRPARRGSSSGLPGSYCYTNTDPATNPTYKRFCFSRGISPYLLRESAKNYKMAFEIWGHGATDTSRYFLGPSYEAVSVNINRLNRDIDITFKKIYNKKTRLRDQFIGTVNLEHHFECYAYRSEDGSSTIEMQAIQNHCNLLIAPFETYGGRITRDNNSGNNLYRWTPWRYDSLKWQMRRGIPRRAIYAGSGIPIFHFDLVRMEDIAEKQNLVGPGGGFDGKIFLSHYYRYFHSLVYFKQGTCSDPGDVPGPPEWDFDHLLNSHEYVVYWIKKMIQYKIIRIKDHAIDIAEEVNNLIKQGSYDSENNLVISDDVAEEVGGLQEYQRILDLFGVSAGTANATLKPIDIKNKLLNTSTLKSSIGPDGSSVVMSVFLPRRAILPSFDGLPGITGWLEASEGYLSYPEYPQFGFTGAEYSSQQVTDIPWFYNNQEEDSVFSNVLSPQRIVSGLGGNFIIDATGKLTPFGASVENEEPNCVGQPQYPSGIGCVPWYLRVTELFDYEGDFPDEGDSLEGIEPKESSMIPDGRVIDLAFKGKNFAVALVDFDYGGIGSRCINENVDAEPATEEIDTPNLNGNNIRNSFDPSCLKLEPFTPGFIRGTEERPGNAYRLKSWGSKAELYGTFSFSAKQQDYINDNVSSFGEYTGRTTGQNRRYPGTNTWFIWTAASAGMKHFAAIDDFGGIFIPPNCDRTYSQSEKGLGAEDIIDNSGSSDFQYGSLHKGFGPDFNYFPHIPRPGYIKEEEWGQTFYNQITLPYSCYKRYTCACHYDQNGACDRPSGGFDNTCADCAGQIFTNEDCTAVDPDANPLFDKTCILMGKLARYANEAGELLDPIDHPGRPRYTKVDCGHYNTLLLSNENKLEIYGKFVKIDAQGEVILEQPIVNSFIPQELLNKKGTWNVTYACNGITCDGIFHSPILSATYTAPSVQNEIKEIKSSADYCIALTGDNIIHIWGDKSMLPNQFNPTSYLPGQTGYTTINLNDVVSIDSITLGVHAFYISYKSRVGNSVASRVYSYTRYDLGIGTQFPTNLQNSRIVDIGAGYIHGIAIYSNRERAIGWDPNAFAKINSDVSFNALNYQFTNFASLPIYFRKQAFFHAIPGYWDYSKWLYGGIGCSSFSSVNTFQAQDNCSALAYNIYKDPTDPLYFDEDASRSGNPQYFWMRKDWRRATFQSLSVVQDNGGGISNEPNKCRPDSAVSIGGPGGNFGEASSSFGTCFNNYGPVWGYGRPMANVHRRVIRVPFGEECITIPCTIPRQYIFVNRTICNNIPYLRLGVDIPPTNAYRSTKDVFQLLWSLFEARKQGICPGLAQQFHSYFKYSERHYYYGYDSLDGAWKVFGNPDFLGNVNPLVVEPCENNNDEDVFEPGEIVSTGSDRCQIKCNPCGFGGGVVGTTGYTGSALENYPRTGPNYARESDVELPSWLITTSNTRPVQETVAGIVNFVEEDLDDPNQPLLSCSLCFGQQSPNLAASSYGGPGAFFWWGLDCNDVVTFNTGTQNDQPRASSLKQNTMYRGYVYNRKIRRTLAARDLLYGVSDGLQQDIDPAIDPSYEQNKKTFIDVLKDSQYTQTNRPWLYGGSDKWIPLCWKSSFILPYESNPNDPQFPTAFFFDNSTQDQNGRGSIIEQIPSQEAITEITFESATASDSNIICAGPNIVELPTFILETNAFQEYTLNEGCLEFNIKSSLTRESNTTKLYAKMYKLKASGEEIFLLESDLSDTIAQQGINVVEGQPIDDDFENTIWNVYFTMDIPETINFDSTDKILIKLFTRYINCYDQDVTKLKVYFGPPNLSRVSYTRYDTTTDDSNHICFAGTETGLSGAGPNAVVYTRNGNQVNVYTAPVLLSLGECCPPE